jgi:hypothetical protein
VKYINLEHAPLAPEHPPLVPKHAPLAPENAPLAREHALLAFEQIQEKVFPFLQTSSDGFDFCDPFNSFGANPVETVKVKCSNFLFCFVSYFCYTERKLKNLNKIYV